MWVGDPLNSVTVYLKANEVIEDTVILNDENNWEYTFIVDDIADKVYSIDEENVTGYTKKMSGNLDTGFIITNTKEVIKEEPIEDDKFREPPTIVPEPKGTKVPNEKPVTTSSHNPNNKNNDILPKTGKEADIVIIISVLALVYLAIKKSKKFNK